MKKLKISLMTVSFIITGFLVNELSLAAGRLTSRPQTLTRMFEHFKLHRRDQLPIAMAAYYKKNSYLLEESNKPYRRPEEVSRPSTPITTDCVISAKKIDHFLWKQLPFTYFVSHFHLKMRHLLRENRQKKSSESENPLIQANPKKGMVLIHGTGEGGWQWLAKNQFMKKEHKEALESVVIVEYDYTQGIKKSCKDVWRQIRDHFDPGAQIVLVGHSQGGIIARAMVEHKDCSEKEEASNPDIKAVFCLSAPLRGVLPLIFLTTEKKITHHHQEIWL